MIEVNPAAFQHRYFLESEVSRREHLKSILRYKILAMEER